MDKEAFELEMFLAQERDNAIRRGNVLLGSLKGAKMGLNKYDVSYDHVHSVVTGLIEQLEKVQPKQPHKPKDESVPF